MLVLLSPAKNMNFDPLTYELDHTQPELMSDARKLAGTAKGLTVGELQSLMGINDDLARLNYERFQSFKARQTPQNALQAALAFNGEVYRGLDARTLGREDLAWAQDHVRILSGLYGALRPLDLIQPYRLEMGRRLKTGAGSTLYDFWDDRITRLLNKAVKKSGSEVVLNLASNEYFSAVKRDKLKGRLVTVDFKEVRMGVAKSLMVYTKKARGLMARYVIERRLNDPEDIKDFTVEGYRFNSTLSKGDKWIFTRESERVAA